MEVQSSPYDPLEAARLRVADLKRLMTTKFEDLVTTRPPGTTKSDTDIEDKSTEDLKFRANSPKADLPRRSKAPMNINNGRATSMSVGYVGVQWPKRNALVELEIAALDKTQKARDAELNRRRIERKVRNSQMVEASRAREIERRNERSLFQSEEAERRSRASALAGRESTIALAIAARQKKLNIDQKRLRVKLSQRRRYADDRMSVATTTRQVPTFSKFVRELQDASPVLDLEDKTVSSITTRQTFTTQRSASQTSIYGPILTTVSSRKHVVRMSPSCTALTNNGQQMISSIDLTQAIDPRPIGSIPHPAEVKKESAVDTQSPSRSSTCAGKPSGTKRSKDDKIRKCSKKTKSRWDDAGHLMRSLKSTLNSTNHLYESSRVSGARSLAVARDAFKSTGNTRRKSSDDSRNFTRSAPKRRYSPCSDATVTSLPVQEPPLSVNTTFPLEPVPFGSAINEVSWKLQEVSTRMKELESIRITRPLGLTRSPLLSTPSWMKATSSSSRQTTTKSTRIQATSSQTPPHRSPRHLKVDMMPPSKARLRFESYYDRYLDPAMQDVERDEKYIVDKAGCALAAGLMRPSQHPIAPLGNGSLSWWGEEAAKGFHQLNLSSTSNLPLQQRVDDLQERLSKQFRATLHEGPSAEVPQSLDMSYLKPVQPHDSQVNQLPSDAVARPFPFTELFRAHLGNSSSQSILSSLIMLDHVTAHDEPAAAENT